MFLEELFAWIKKYGSRSIQLGTKEEGAAIKRRLQELLELEKPIPAEIPSAESGTLHGVKNLFEGRDGLSSSHTTHYNPSHKPLAGFLESNREVRGNATE